MAKSKAKTTVFDYQRKSNRFFTHLAAHFRERDRKNVAIRCEVDVVLRNGKIVNTGRASIKNLSANGALLANFILKEKMLPAKPFRIQLRMLTREFKGITVKCIPVRLEVEDGFGIGVKFQDISVEV